MAKDRLENSERPESNGGVGGGNGDAPAPEQIPNPGQAGQTNVQLDESGMVACYANFCKVSSTPEELILDLGLNPQPYGQAGSIKVSQRIVLNHFTAKRLLQALAVAVQRHEQAFGEIETDVRKRVRQS